MTLIVTVNGRESIWLLADRRLSYKGRAPKDDGRKVMFLETTDGVAILGYAGLGATALGTEPADWMSAVLRGRNLPLEESLGVLSEAMKRQLPRHIARLPGLGGPAHNLFATAFLDDEVRLYTIDLLFAADRKRLAFRYTRHVIDTTSGRTPRLGIGGSGALCLFHNRHWMRPLLRLASAYEHGQVSALAVADHLAALNYKVHQDTSDQSVGPACIVAWRNRKSGFHKGGGGHQSYVGDTRDGNSPLIPTIATGMDLNAIIGVMMPKVTEMFEAMRAGDSARELDKDEINSELARLSDKPDENLR